jgi:uncharacterized membrane protein YdbT with pleckstrin-like domain
MSDLSVRYCFRSAPLVANAAGKAKPLPLHWQHCEGVLMRYVDEVLQPGETVRQVTTKSWVLYLRGVALWVLAALLWAMFASYLLGQAAAAAAFLIGCYFVVKTWWNRLTTEVAVTDRRVIYKTGFISRNTREMHMDKIASVDVKQGILGRVLNFGDITINGTGGNKEEIPGIDRPLEFRSHVTAE